MSILSPSAPEIEVLASREGLTEIQFCQSPDRAALEMLELKISRHRPDYEVRFYGFYREKCDLGIVRHIPSVRKLVVNCLQGEVEGIEEIGQLKNLVSLKIGVESLQDLAFLEQLPPILETLYLEEAKKKNLNLSVLRRFSRLRWLYLERHHEKIEVVGELSSLQELVLRSISVPTLSFLSSLQNLRLLDLKLGGTTNLEVLPKLSNVSHLEIWQVRKLADLDDVMQMPNLEILYLQDLPNVTRMPSCASMRRLKEVHLHHLTGLTDITCVAKAPALEWFSLTHAGRCSAEIFRPLLEHPTLKRVSVGMGSFRKNREVRALFAGSQVLVDGAFGDG
jgi:Leucine-rich repeat (LRR) protein